MASENLSPSLTVQIGKTRITAVICTSSCLSLMAQSLYDQLRADSPTLKEIASEKTINGVKINKVVLFDALLCESPIELMVHVVEICAMGLILGCDFLSKTQSDFCIHKGTFKWMHNNAIQVSEFISHAKTKTSRKSTPKQDSETLKASFGLKVVTKDTNGKTQSFQKHGVNTEIASTGDKSNNPIQPAKQNKVSSDGFQLKYYPPKDNSTKLIEPQLDQPTEGKSIIKTVRSTVQLAKQNTSSGGFQLKYYPPKDTLTKSKPQVEDKFVIKTPRSTIQDGWATVYVTTRRLINLLGFGPPLGYYGIWWCDQCESNIIRGGLPVEIETMIGVNCRAVAEALRQAQEHGITRLRIVINRNEGLDLFKSYARNNVLKKPSHTKCELYEVYTMYKGVCMLIREMDKVKFDYFPDDNKSPESLRNLREDVHKYIAFKDKLRDDRVAGFFDYVPLF